jgi:hypothetical protein
MAGVAVTVEQAGRVVALAVTPADGTFKFTGVAPGDYQIRAVKCSAPRSPRSPCERSWRGVQRDQKSARSRGIRTKSHHVETEEIVGKIKNLSI